MSTISSTSASQIYAQRSPPQHHGSMKGRMTATLDSEVASGSLSSTDATALTSALSAIDSSLSADTSGTTAGGTAADGTGPARSRLDPASMKDRIDGLIADQVSSGSLTSDQAGALKNLFASHGRSTEASDATADVSGVGGLPPGPPPGPPPSEAASGASSGSGSSNGAAGGSSASDLLATFIQQLQAAQASSAGYAASGTSATTQASALLFDFQS